MAKVKQTAKRSGSFAHIALLLLCGVAVGFAAGVRLAEAASALPFGQYLLAMAWMMFAGVFAVYAQILLHEGGHLVCGLATGYRFCSFRVGSFQWQKENGRLRLRRMSLAGTGGQCLLSPPELVDGKMPYVLYNLGGPLANLLTAGVFFALSLACRGVWGARVFWETLAVVGAVFALLNGVPMRIGGLDNDGRNALSLGQDPAALRALWVQLKVNEQQTCGVRLKEMPAGWFALPEPAALSNPMTAALAVLAENRLMDEQNFAAAAHLTDELQRQQTAIPGLQQELLLCDRLSCALLSGEDATALFARWNEKAAKAFRKQMKDFLTVLRTEYTAALLAEKDPAKAEAFAARFAKRAKTHPFPADAQSERELILLAAQTAKERGIL